MDTNQPVKTDVQQRYRYYLKKRNNFLFFTLVIFILLVSSFAILWATGNSFDLLSTIYFPVVLIVLGIVTWYRPRYNYYVMKLDYYRMLKENLGLIKLNKPLFTKSFVKQFIEDGFKKAPSHPDFVLYYQFFTKLPAIVNSGQVLVCIVLAKNENVDFYSDDLDHAINKLYETYPDRKKVRKQIVLQFKKYKQYNEDIKDEIDRIINYKVGDNYIIHITIGYFQENQQIYFLRPKKRYPNKFYYYAVKLIRKYTGLTPEV